jgi:hypothetical protein
MTQTHKMGATTLIIMAPSIAAFSITTHSVRTLSITILIITTFSRTINETRHSA